MRAINKFRLRSVEAVIALLFLIWVFGGGDAWAEISPEDLSKAFREAAKEVKPAVVSVYSTKTLRAPWSGGPFMEPPEEFRFFFGPDFFERFFGTPREQKRTGLGSGVIVSRGGYILTNNHVVEGAEEIKVKVPDIKKEFKAKLVGRDKKSDIAVIKIEGTNLPVAKLGDSDEIDVGDWVIAIGNPFGLTQTVTAGIISAKGRGNVNIAEYEDFIQTDAAINRGNSGGPLINLRGEVIGINTAIVTPTGAYAGIGFAIPINMARKIMEDLIKEGKVLRGWLGIAIQSMNEDLAKRFGVEAGSGVLVSDVKKGSPAEKAGLKREDIITEFDGHRVAEPEQLRNIVALTPPGTKAKVKIIRNGEEKVLTIKVGTLTEAALGKATAQDLGMTVQNLTPEIASRYGYKPGSGVIITKVEPGSPADEAGLQPGDLILEVERQKVKNISSYQKALERADISRGVLLLVQRGSYAIYVVIGGR